MSRPRERVDRVREQIGMLVRVVEIGDRGVHVAGAARLAVSGDGSEFVRIARDEKELSPRLRPDAACRPRRCRR